MASETKSKMSDVNMSDVKVEEKTEPIPISTGTSTKTEEEVEDLDAQLEKMKKRLEEVETARAKLPNEDKEAKEEKSNAPSNGNVGIPSMMDVDAAIAESDSRSVYVGNVDYGATVEELNQHFSDCGTINRVTIMCNKMTGMPKGFAYIEFAEEDAVKHATILDGTTFRQRKIKVVAKRTNVPGMSRGRARRFRGRGFRGRGRRGFRGRGWSPY